MGAGALIVLAAATRSGPSDTVWIAIVTAIAAIAGAWLTRDVKKQNKAASEQLTAIKHEVKNSHGTNLRDDVDDLRRLITQIADGQDRLSRSIGGLHDDVRILHDRDGQQANDVTTLRRELPRLIAAGVAEHLDRDQQG